MKLVEQLLDKSMGGKLAVSLDSYLTSGLKEAAPRVKDLKPEDYYLSSSFVKEAPYRIAIVPFLNRYARRNAGFIVPLHLASALHRRDNLEVFEPGLVREQLLKYRLIMRSGPSLATADVLASETTLGGLIWYYPVMSSIIRMMLAIQRLIFRHDCFPARNEKLFGGHEVTQPVMMVFIFTI